MRERGLTLLELLITLAILAILITIGLPSFSRQIQSNRVAANTEELASAVQLVRATAVSRNRRVTLRNAGSWESGWQAFVDDNENGLLDNGESLVFSGGPLESVGITWNGRNAPNYVSFVGSGASERVGGGFQAGTFRICPNEGTAGYALTLAASGRLRSSRVSDCNP